MKVSRLLLFCLLVQAVYANLDKSLFQLGQRAFNDAAYNFAVGRFKKLISEHPDSLHVRESRYLLGLSYFHLKQFEQASQSLNAFIHDYPLDGRTPFSRYYLARILYEKGKYTACVDESQRLLAKEKNQEISGNVRILLADCYVQLKQDKLAVKEFEKVEGVKKKEALFKLGKYYLQKKDHANAELNFEHLLRYKLSEELKISSIYFYGKSLYYQDKFASALDQFSNLNLEYPKHPYRQEVDFLVNYMPFAKKEYTVAIKSFLTYLQSPREKDYRHQAMYHLGRSYEYVGQDILALNQYKGLIEESQEYKVDALYRSALLFRQSKNLDQMVHCFESLLAESPSREHRLEALKELSFYFLEKDEKKADDYFKELIGYLDKNEDPLFYYQWYGQGLAKQGNHLAAVDIYKTGLAKDIVSEYRDDLYLYLGHSYLRLKNVPASKNAYEKALELVERNTRTYLEAQDGIAYGYYLEKKYQEGLRIYNGLLKVKNPKVRESAVFFSAEIYRLMDEKDEAIDRFELFLNEFPESTKKNLAYLKLGKLLYEHKDYRESSKLYSEMLEDVFDEKMRVQAYFWLGWSDYQLGELEKANKSFISASSQLDVHPLALDALLVSGKIHFQLKNYVEASQAFILYLNEEKTNEKAKPKAYYELGQCFLQLHDPGQCEIFYHRLAKLYPREKNLIFSGYTSLAEYYSAKKRWLDAINVLEKISELEITDEELAQNYYRTARIYKDLNQKDKEVTLYTKIIGLGKTSYLWDAKYLRAKYLSEVGEGTAAAKIFREMIEKSDRKDLIAIAKQYLTQDASEEEVDRVRNANQVDELEATLERLKSNEAIALAHFKLAEGLKKERKLDEAIKHYKTVTEHSTDELSKKSQWMIVQYYYTKEAYQNAYNEGMTFLYLYDLKKKQDEDVLYTIGMSAHKVGADNDAERLFKNLKESFPESKYLKELPY